ncbi:hypothetical protein CR513_19723, partial [Mucuna pruriens]
MAGQITPCSLRLWGQVANQRVRVLIDKRASHNLMKVPPSSSRFSQPGDTPELLFLSIRGNEGSFGTGMVGNTGDMIANFRESRLIIDPYTARQVLQGDPEFCYVEFLIQLWPAHQQNEAYSNSNIPEEIS